jgi:hypothetical protein
VAVNSRRSATGRAARTPQKGSDDPSPKKPLGRPKGEPSTIVNIRIPLVLLERLDRYIDRLERDTGLKANRGMIGRRALELFLESHETRAQR